MNKKQITRRKLDPKNVIIAILLISIISILVIILLLKMNKKTEQVSAKTSNENMVKNETNIKNNIINVEIDSKQIESEHKKIDYLENVKGKVYKKSEKNIKIPIIIYHNFRTPIPYKEDVYKLFSSEENFEENVKTLLDNGYTIISLEDLYKYNKGEIGLPEKVVILTMDDGQVGCYTDAFPVLKKYNVPATIFIVNKLVGTEDYFSWEQAKEMYDTGLVQIHCHGYNHSAYDNVPKEVLISDYNKSHKEIEEHLGEKIQKIMAYPAGKSSANTIKWLKEAGFEVQVQTRYGTVNKSKDLDLTNLGRIRGERVKGREIINNINAS